jgi:hypothetical protein
MKPFKLVYRCEFCRELFTADSVIVDEDSPITVIDSEPVPLTVHKPPCGTYFRGEKNPPARRRYGVLTLVALEEK